MGYIRASSAGAVATSQAQDLLANLNNEIETMVELLETMKQ
jgi:predicted transcriptional regulator